MRYTPQTFTIYSALEVVMSGEVVDTERVSGVTVRGQITPERTSKAYENWGLDLKRPHLLMLKITDKDRLKAGDYVHYGPRRFYCHAVKLWEAVSGANGVEAMLEEMD